MVFSHLCGAQGNLAKDRFCPVNDILQSGAARLYESSRSNRPAQSRPARRVAASTAIDLLGAGRTAARVNISIARSAQLRAAQSLRVRLTRSLGRGFNPWARAFD